MDVAITRDRRQRTAHAAAKGSHLSTRVERTTTDSIRSHMDNLQTKCTSNLVKDGIISHSGSSPLFL
jgi:hypothetical protein